MCDEKKIGSIVELKLNPIKTQLELMQQDVGFIKDQTTKTNGRVTTLEPKVRDLEEKNTVYEAVKAQVVLEQNRQGVKTRNMIVLVGVLVAVVALLIEVIKGLPS